MAIIRPETEADFSAVRAIHTRAFGRTQEADLVDELRQHPAAVLSLVAVRRGEVVGHAFFSRVVIPRESGYDRGVGLGPVGVLPEHQRTGLGIDLVRYGIAALKNRRYGILVVLGDPAYYRRFGFQPATRYNLRGTFPSPPEHFMALPLDADWCGPGGLVRYASPFHID